MALNFVHVGKRVSEARNERGRANLDGLDRPVVEWQGGRYSVNITMI